MCKNRFNKNQEGDSKLKRLQPPKVNNKNKYNKIKIQKLKVKGAISNAWKNTKRA